MFPQSGGWTGNDWYGSSMGPPSSHPRAQPPQPLTFDNAYNFHGSAHVMTQPMQPEFAAVQLPQHHPFTVSPRTPHTATTPIYHEPSGYHSPGLNGYHVSMTAGSAAAAEKNSLLQLSAAGGVRQSHAGVVHHQGNLQPGYPPRPVEISSPSCDKLLTTAVTSTSSTGYPGLGVTGQPVTQDERVTSSSRSKHHPTKDNSTLLLPPPPDYGSRLSVSAVSVNPSPLLYSSPIPSEFLQPPLPPGMTALHSPNTQPTFLACSAAEELAMDDNQSSHTLATEFVYADDQTPSHSCDNRESLSSLAGTSAAPNQDDINNNHVSGLHNNKFRTSDSFVSNTKALLYSTSNQKNSSLSQSEFIPQLDGALDTEVEDQDYQPTPTRIAGANSAKKSASKSRKPQMEGRDEENITLRTPLEVYNDVVEDKDYLSNLTDEQKQTLTMRAGKLKEISPSCSCAEQGLQGSKI